jgi:hypothetical protein
MVWTIRAPSSCGDTPPPALTDPAPFVRALGRLAERLAGLEWMVVSGLALPLACGRFYRQPSDIDIAAPERAARAVAVALRDAGYRVFARSLSTRLAAGRRLELHLAVDPARCPLERLVRRRLRLQSRPARDAAARILVELFPYREIGGEVEIERGLRLPRFEPHFELRRLPDGTPIPVENLAYVQCFKRQRPEAKHRFDLQLLSQLYGELDRPTAEPVATEPS